MRFENTVAGLLMTVAFLAGSSVSAKAKPPSLSEYVNAALRNNPLVGSAAQA